MKDEQSVSSFRLHPSSFFGTGCGDETRTRTISFTRRALCYPIELRGSLVDWEGFKPSQEVCKTSMLSVTSPAQSIWWLWVESNHQPRAYETFALPLELHSRLQSWKPAEELNLMPSTQLL